MDCQGHEVRSTIRKYPSGATAPEGYLAVTISCTPRTHGVGADVTWPLTCPPAIPTLRSSLCKLLSLYCTVFVSVPTACAWAFHLVLVGLLFRSTRVVFSVASLPSLTTVRMVILTAPLL